MEPTLFDLVVDEAAPRVEADLVQRVPTRRPAPAPATGPVLLAVDGNSLAHRAFHAYGGDLALYGFGALLAALCDLGRAERVLVGFDCRERSERREAYPAYKAGRPPKDDRLHDLLDYAPSFLTDLGVATLCPAGWEADDAVASAAAAAEAAGWRCAVATSDRDAFALVSERTTVLRLRSGMSNAVEVTPARLRRDLGIAPEQYLELAALRGDTSDNLPGVEGIGPVRAAALLREYPTVDAAVADPYGCRSVLGAEVGQRLIDDLAAEDSVFRRNVALMTLRRDLPIDLETTAPVYPPARIEAVAREWALPALGARLAVALGTRPDPPPPPPDAPPW